MEEDVEKIIRMYMGGKSIQQTAKAAGVSTVKVRRILITAGLWSSRTSDAIGRLHKQGLSTEEIADRLCLSVKNVQAYLPYSRGEQEGYGSVISTAAQRCLDYRSRIERHRETVKKGKENNMAEKKWKSDERRAVLLKTELDNELYDFDDERALMQYAGLKTERTIQRDFLVPSDITLYALHYAIQRAYGWENSHLHCFRLKKTEEDNRCGTIETWQKNCGILFRSPYMEEEGKFWMDDYENGSFRNWLRTKYTGPYVHQTPWEDEKRCQQEAVQAVMDFHRLEKEYRNDEFESAFQQWCAYYETDPCELRESLSIEELLERKILELRYHYDYGDGWIVKIYLVPADTVNPQLAERVIEEYRPVCVRRTGLAVMDDAGGLHGYVRFLRSLHHEEEIQRIMNSKNISQEEAEEEFADMISPYTDRESSLNWASIFSWKEKMQNEKSMF